MKYGIRVIAYIVIGVVLYFSYGYYKDLARQVKQEEAQSAQKQADLPPLNIAVDEEGKITLDGDPAPLENLTTLLQAMEVQAVTLQTPADPPIEQLERVLNAIRKADVHQISMGVLNIE